MRPQVMIKTLCKYGRVVSTVDLPDGSYETAIVAPGQAPEPIEMYETQALARIGHNKWVKVNGGRSFWDWLF